MPPSLLSIDLLELVIELALIWAVVYFTVRFLQGTRGAGIVKGFAVLLAAFVLLQLLGLGTERFARLNFIIDYFVGLVAILLIVIFQPELRQATMRLGQARLLRSGRRYEYDARIGVAVPVRVALEHRPCAVGIDLIRRHMADAPEGEPRGYGITAPLITKADGTKFGKTETGTVWLTADRTSPWAFYQFWLNASDEDAGRFLRIYTFLDQSTIEDLETRHAAAPHERISQHMLASELTCMMHGADELARVEAAAAALFGGGVRDLEEDMLEAVFADVESSNHNRTALDGGVPLAELLADTGLAKSRREAREFLKAGSVSVNGEKISGQEAVDRSLAAADLLHGHTILLRRGKKAWHCTRWS